MVIIVYVILHYIIYVVFAQMQVVRKDMRDKNGRHKWGTIFDKYELKIPIGDWYINARAKVH